MRERGDASELCFDGTDCCDPNSLREKNLNEETKIKKEDGGRTCRCFRKLHGVADSHFCHSFSSHANYE